VVERVAEALATLGDIDEALELALTLDRRTGPNRPAEPDDRGEREGRPLLDQQAVSVADSAVTRVVEAAAARGDLDAAVLAAASIGNATQRAWALLAVVTAHARMGDRDAARLLARDLGAALDLADATTRAVGFARLVAALGANDASEDSLSATASTAADRLASIGDLPGLTRALTYLRAGGVTARDPLALLDATPDAPARDRVALRLVAALVDVGQVDEAAKVAATVSAPASRARALAAVAAHQPDPRAARATLSDAGENTAGDDALVDHERTLANVAVTAAAVDDGPATRVLVAEVLAGAAWPEVLPALARIEPAAVRAVADRLREPADSEPQTFP
jgi:hypothetical protein